MAKPLRDQPAVEAIEPRIRQRARLATRAPVALVERHQLVVDLERGVLVVRDLRRHHAGLALRAPDLAPGLAADEREIAGRADAA